MAESYLETATNQQEVASKHYARGLRRRYVEKRPAGDEFEVVVVLALVSELGPVPFAFIPATLNVYAVAAVRPVTVTGELAAVPVRLPGVDVAM